MIRLLFVSKSGLVEEDTVEVFHRYGVHLSPSFLCKFQVLSGKIVMGSISVSFPHLRAFGQLMVHLPMPSEKAVGIWCRENPYPGIYSVPSYVSNL